MTEKLPPANIEAEEAILGGIIFDPKAFERIYDWLPVEAFYVKKHQMIYQACLFLKETDKKTDYITLVDWFSSRQLLEEVGGTGYLARLLNRTVSAINIDYYAKLVKDKYLRRQLIKVGYEIAELGYSNHLELDDIYQQIRDQLPSKVIGKDDQTKPPTNIKLRYAIGHPTNENAKLELEAEVTDDNDLEDKITSLWLKAEAICKRIWSKGKKNLSDS